MRERRGPGALAHDQGPRDRATNREPTTPPTPPMSISAGPAVARKKPRAGIGAGPKIGGALGRSERAARAARSYRKRWRPAMPFFRHGARVSSNFTHALCPGSLAPGHFLWIAVTFGALARPGQRRQTKGPGERAAGASVDRVLLPGTGQAPGGTHCST